MAYKWPSGQQGSPYPVWLARRAPAGWASRERCAAQAEVEKMAMISSAMPKMKNMKQISAQTIEGIRQGSGRRVASGSVRRSGSQRWLSQQI